jgi:DNA-binding ferritin-like protein
MMKSLFPEEMLSKGSSEMTLESIASKMLMFYEHLHLIHWQTVSFAEHKATNKLYDYLHEFRDDLMEKLMGYTGKKPVPYKLESLSNISAGALAVEMSNFASALKQYGEMNAYHDVCNLADSLSGEVSKFKYLLTLS